MSRFRVVLILLLCLTVPIVGWATVLDPRHSTPSTEHAVPHTVAAADWHHPAAVAESGHRHFHGDHATRDDGHCKHGCVCGCDMGTCGSACLALFGLQSAFPWNAASNAILRLVGQQPADARGTSPLRPPIV